MTYAMIGDRMGISSSCRKVTKVLLGDGAWYEVAWRNGKSTMCYDVFDYDEDGFVFETTEGDRMRVRGSHIRAAVEVTA